MATIHWKSPVNGDFNTAADWSSGTVPGASDDAILDAKGANFTVTASTSEDVNSIQLSSNATLDIDSGTFIAGAGTGSGANAGSIVVGDNTTFSVAGGLDNTGTISIASGGNDTTQLLINAKNVTLSGGGHVTLSDQPGSRIIGAVAGDVLTNVNNTISGSGNLGAGQMTLINQAAGVVDATGTNVSLTLDTSGETVTNAGLIEATGSAGLGIVNTMVNDSTGGIISAGTGSHVSLQSADIIGGTLTTTGTGFIQTVDGGSMLDGTTATVTNSGQLDIIDNTALTIQGAITNTKTGAINLDSAGNDGTLLVIGALNATVSGGVITMSDQPGNQIFGTLSGPGGSQVVSTLTNKTTIVGSGNIGERQMMLVNDGVIDATGGNALIIDTGGGNGAGSNVVANSGTLEATNPSGLTGTGGLVLSGVTISNGSTGLIEANGASTHINLATATISGGTLETLNGGVIETVDRSSVLDGTSATVNNTGTVFINDNTSLTIQGAIDNTGTIDVASLGNDTTQLVIGAAGAVLTGSGHVVLSDTPGNEIFGAAAGDVLTNVNNTISGSGSLGAGQLTLVNEAAGVIDATGTSVSLTLNTNGETMTNAGLIEATGSAGLGISSTTIKNSGTISALAGSHVTLATADIIGGTLTSKGTGFIQTGDRGTVLDGTGSTLNLAATMQINDNQSLTIIGTINNTGVIGVDSGGNDTTQLLIGAAGATLTGGGSVIMTDAPGNQILGIAATDVLTNVNNTISGSGNLGDGQLTLINEKAGVIDATGSANSMTLDTAGETMTNAGLIEATGSAGLGIVNTTIKNSGVISVGAGSQITLVTADIIGGTLTTTGTGFIQTGDRGTVLDGTGSALNLAARMQINDNQSLTIIGTINNTDVIGVDSAGNDTTQLLIGAAGATLTGGGSVIMTDAPGNQILGIAATDVLTNVNNTISGSGNLGDGQLTLINEKAGVIDATGSANSMVLDTAGETVTNAGLIEATGSAGLAIVNTAINGSTGGVILAANGSHISLQSADIIGGTLSSSGSGLFETVDGGTLFDGTKSVVNVAGLVQINDNQALTLAGTINNTGQINVDSGGNDTTRLIISGNVTLEGNGTVSMSGQPGDQILGASASAILTNESNTISGGGALGGGVLTLVNEAAGVIDATGGNALVINTGANTIINAGLIEVTNPAGLTIDSPIDNTGTLLAHSGTLTLVGALTNVSGTTLTGGAYEADAGATLELPQNTDIVTDKATIILNGTGSVIEAFNTSTNMEVAIDSTLTTVAATGVLEIIGGRNWTTTSAFSNAGLLQLGGGTFAAKSLSNSGTTIGFGAITAPLTNSGVLSVQASKTLSLGTLTNLSGTVLTGGTYIVGAGATLQLAKNLSIVTLNATIDLAGVGATLESLDTANSKQVTLDSTLATIGASGVLEVLGGRAYTTANAIANGGAIQLGGGIFTSGTLTDSAASSLSGFGTLASVFSDAGKVTASGGALAFTGAGDTFAGAIGGTEVDFAGGSDTLNSGTSLGVATLGLSGGASVTLGVSLAFGGTLVDGAGTTLALGANTLTLTGAGSTIAGTLSGSTGSVLVFGGGSQTLNAGASIGAKSWSLSGGDATTVATNLTYAGTFNENTSSSLSVGAGDTLGFTGAVTLAGAVSGGGTLSQSGGTEAINAGATLGIAAWTLKNGAAAAINENLTFKGAFSEDATSSITIGAGDTLTLGGTAAISGALGATGALSLAAGAEVTIDGAVSFGGAFSQAAATTTVSAGDTFALQGAATFGVGAIVNGAGLLTVANATVSGLTIGGTLTLSDVGVVDQIGSITLGDATNSAAELTVGKGDTYKLDGNVGIARGKSKKSAMTVAGTLIKTSGTGVSVIGVNTTDSGLIEAATGTLEFTQKLAGKGALKIDAGATLQVAKTAASTLTTTFNGAGATLALGKVAKFAATVGGFTTGETIDLLKTAATGATLNGKDQLVIVNGKKTVATLQLSGNYAGFVFDVGSDGHSGSAITLAASQAPDLPAPGPFVQAMASMGGHSDAMAWREPVGMVSHKDLALALVSGHHPLA